MTKQTLHDLEEERSRLLRDLTSIRIQNSFSMDYSAYVRATIRQDKIMKRVSEIEDEIRGRIELEDL